MLISNLYRHTLMAVLCIFFLALQLPALGVPLRYIPKLQCELKIDGKLNESCYEDNQPVKNFKIAGQPEKPAPSTQAWVFWNENKIVFSFNCVDEKIGAKPPSWDEMAVAPQDRVEFYLWSGNEQDTFISFEIAPLGAALDYRAQYYRFLNFGWKPETLNYSVSLTPQGYCMEAQIYIEDLAQAKIELYPGSRFRAGLFRSEVDSVEQENEPTWITWVDASEPFPDFHIPRSLGEFVLEDEDHPGPLFADFGYWEVGDNQLKLRPKKRGNTAQIFLGERVQDWQLIWTGQFDDNRWALLESDSGYALLSDECRIIRLTHPSFETNESNPKHLYGGKEAKEILASSRDILGEKILDKETINPQDIAKLLPPLSNGYQILGSPLTGGVSPIITCENVIKIGDKVLFNPAEIEPSLNDLQPSRGLIDGWMPIADYLFSSADNKFIYNAFVPVWERGDTPSVWVRLAEIDTEGQTQKAKFWTVSSKVSSLDANTFWTEFVRTVFHWKNYAERLSLPKIPDQDLLNTVKGSLALAHIIFAGKHPHYGARYYGNTVHDTFPPAFIAVLESAFMYGEHDWIKRLTDFWFQYCVNQDGTIRYWQRDVRTAASASEYGMIFHLIEKIDRAWNQEWDIENYFDQLEAAAHYLHSLRRISRPEDCKLIHLGAEADNAELKKAYFSNNLWAVRGIESLSILFERYNRKGTAAQLRHMSQDLYKHIQNALSQTAIETSYGLLPPIHPGYAALPLTLSAGLEKPDDISEEIWNAYLNNKSVSIPFDGREQPSQNLRENTYANYRYYLEMLSSGGIPEEMAEAIAKMRTDRGGELLGMTRFSGHLDDWPVAEWAKFLLSTDRLEKYWLLLHSHIKHHQDRDTLTAFEQVRIDGKYHAPDCIPSQLVSVRLLAWAFAFEFPGDEHLYLLRGIPQKWFQAGNELYWPNLSTSAGKVSLRVISQQDEIEIQADISKLNIETKPILQLNLFEKLKGINIENGQDLIEKIEDNRIYIKEGKKGKLNLFIER